MEQTFTKLKAWRTTEGFSLSELSGVTGVSVAMLSRAERNQRRFSARAKVQMARRLGVTVGELFDVEPIEDDAALDVGSHS
jgi:transcriptional regulator with XRE-family HTH domain